VKPIDNGKSLIYLDGRVVAIADPFSLGKPEIPLNFIKEAFEKKSLRGENLAAD
jgi:hypothetical protein